MRLCRSLSPDLWSPRVQVSVLCGPGLGSPSCVLKGPGHSCLPEARPLLRDTHSEAWPRELSREKAGRPQPFPLPGAVAPRQTGCLQCRRRRFGPRVGKTPWRRAWRPPRCSCLESSRTEGCCPQTQSRSTDATRCAHTPQNQSPHRPAVEKTRRLPVSSLALLQRHGVPRDLDPVRGTTDIARWRDARLPAGLPPTSRHSRPRDKWEISREDVKGLPCPIQAGREDEKVVVRLGLSGDDAIRILSQQVPRQHPRRDHGNSPPFRHFGRWRRGPLGIFQHGRPRRRTGRGLGGGVRVRGGARTGRGPGGPGPG